jgi:Bacterial regulatory protein, Fis family
MRSRYDELGSMRRVSRNVTARSGVPPPRGVEREAGAEEIYQRWEVAFERRHLIDVLDEARLDKRKAADLPGISLASLYRKLSPTPDGTPPPAEDA